MEDCKNQKFSFIDPFHYVRIFITAYWKKATKFSKIIVKPHFSKQKTEVEMGKKTKEVTIYFTLVSKKSTTRYHYS